ncbi:Protein of unknown function [Cnuella takakiae]|uniref:DUF3293 domain-containing protein n=1 Tax=Cnuella takakiae TaxID=1302690 RepID=A0A1M4T7Z0_9BACT|nr:DUF3293 domain-containing protein [Cnuella takakiae]OLY90688.1 hypothetical protein BUE76_01320 [Cnuella takakiae]SHE40448.1 Protein of unknown function [Cnuella takakiae]
MTTQSIPADLYKAYLHTTYQVYRPSIAIKIGNTHPQLDALLATHDAVNWAFLTAYNPYSQVLPATENEQRNKALEALLAPYPYYAGAGMGEDPSWTPEASFRVLGIDCATAHQLGKQFGQNAIVAGIKGERAELIITL